MFKSVLTWDTVDGTVVVPGNVEELLLYLLMAHMLDLCSQTLRLST